MQKIHKLSAVMLAVYFLLVGITGCAGNRETKKRGDLENTPKITAEEKEKGLGKKTETAATATAETEKAVLEQEKATAETRAEQEKKQIREKADRREYHILVKKSAFTLYLLDEQNKVIRSYDCTIGKNPGQKEKRGDMKTPVGTFYVDEIDDASYWTHDFGDGNGEIKGAYGPWFISLNTDDMSKGAWGGIGIHGTHKPEAMRIRDSEGCVRLRNENVVELKQYVRVGTKVSIEE